VRLDIIKVFTPTDEQVPNSAADIHQQGPDMQPHHQINHTNVFSLSVLTTVTLASSNSALPDDGDYTETCWIFNLG